MNAYVEFVVLGFSTGAIYVALSLGLVTIYRASAVLNFAQGAMAVWGAYVYAVLRASGQLVLPIGSISLGGPLGFFPALAIGLVMALIVGLLAHFLVFRPLHEAPALARLVASIAVMIMMQALELLRFGSEAVQVSSVLPSGSVAIAGATLNTSDLMLAGIAILVSIAAWAFFRFTNVGLAMMAASVNEKGLMSLGYSPSRLGAIAWMLGTMMSYVIIVLASSATGLSAVDYSLYVIPALAVLLLARLRSIGTITVAGLALGAFQSVITLMSTKSWWPSWAQAGVSDSVPFILIVVVLYVWGRRLPARGSLETASLPRVRLPDRRSLSLITPMAIMVLAVVLTHGTYRFGVITSIALALLALSYVILVGYLGQISLAQVALAGTAGFALSKLTTSWAVPFPWSLLISALAAAALGVMIALPALRIRGTQLAIVTLAAALTLQEFVFTNAAFTTSLAGNIVAQPGLFGLSLAIQQGHNVATLAFGLMVVVVTAALFGMFVLLARGRTGRAWLAVRSNERAALAAGVNVRLVKIVGFGISGLIAGVAGSLLAMSVGQLSADSFSVSVGLELLAVSYLGGITSMSGAFVAGALGPAGIVFVVLDAHISFGQYYDLIAGFGLVLAAIFNPGGIAGQTAAQWQWARRQFHAGRGGAKQAGAADSERLAVMVDAEVPDAEGP